MPIVQNSDATSNTLNSGSSPSKSGSIFAPLTPNKLRWLLCVVSAWTLLFVLVSTGTVEQHERAVKTIAFDAAPSVIQAFNIKAGLQRIDNDMLVKLLSDEIAEDAGYAVEDVYKQQSKIAENLVGAARNITYGESERLPIQAIQTNLILYMMNVQRIFDAEIDKPRDKDALIADYLQSKKILSEKLLPACDQLNKANTSMLEGIYQKEKSSCNLFRGLVAVLGFTLMCFLLYVQFFLSWKFHRRINPAMLLATIALAVFLHHLYTSLLESSADLKIAKEDAYDSVISLMSARSSAYSALGDQTRALFNPKNASSDLADYARDIKEVASFDKGHGYAETIAKAQEQVDAGKKISLQGFDGFLAQELNNIRFLGEPRAALTALGHFGAYTDFEFTLNKLLADNDRKGAIKASLGFAPHQRMYSFGRFDDGVEQTLKINMEHWHESAADSLHILHGLVLKIQILCTLIVLFAAAGILPRIDEYFQCGTPD